MVKKQKNKWFWKIAKGLITFVGVAGIISIINFYNQEKDRNEKIYKHAIQEWRSELNLWNNWSPKELATGEFPFDGNGLDLETGESHSNYNKSQMDLFFNGGDKGVNSYLRSSNGTKWVNKGLIKIDNTLYSELRDANFKATKNPKSNYYDLFHEHPSNSPAVGFTYFIKTKDGNLSIVQIKNYETISISNGHFYRKMKIWFKTYPNVEHPSKPIRPSRP